VRGRGGRPIKAATTQREGERERRRADERGIAERRDERRTEMTAAGSRVRREA